MTLSEMLSPSEQQIYRSQAQFPPERIVSDLVGYLSSLARDTPVTIALENVDCVDDQTKVFLEQLFFRAPEVPLTLVLTRRAHKSACPIFETASKCLMQQFTYMQLDGLDAFHSTTLLGYFDHSRPSRNDILDLSAGNPLFIEEYSKWADHHVRMRSTRIDRAIRSRIAQMSGLPRLVAESIALFEEPIGVEIIIAISGIDAVGMTQAATYLRVIGVTQEHEACICIKYPILRQKLYARISRRRRINLHRAAFRILEDRKDCSLELLARHAFKGELFNEANKLYERLANADYDHGNFAKATIFFEYVLKCTAAVERKVNSTDQFKLARCYSRIGKHSVARCIYQGLISTLTKDQDHALISSIYTDWQHHFTLTLLLNQSDSVSKLLTYFPKMRHSKPCDTPI